ncbi:arginyl-tRNA synthetase [Cruoricaptor ignavus]|uniref:Arginine--tRNA ligase n=1 Tax=Cruoricaptor ignavus TaxID=1118202 RepID=A0A1M6G5M9_9FLAO|nr:arginine--tRNA ligase [Cruoricaptor ignavus]SHJ05245.1 arginyl-tRNA synthetase [Cruoricaptor ignavus]
MSIKATIASVILSVLKDDFQLENAAPEVQPTKDGFEGDFTVVIFPLVKLLKKSPDEIGKELGGRLQERLVFVESFNVVKGFLNLKIKDEHLLEDFRQGIENLRQKPQRNETVMVEFSSPNTNKPLHLGHIRNNLLGWSVSQILQEDGYDVIKTQIINDRGIHICKSMLAWEKSGRKETPENSGMKGDHLVGKYYVEFDKVYKDEARALQEKGLREDEAKRQAASILEAQEMLVKWEQNDKAVRNLWREMNAWVYAGFNETYRRLGVSFDQIQYESETYLLGKDLIQKGLDEGVFYRREDGSVWVDLADEGLDQKLLLRADGTSVYMTQDLGTAVQRFEQNEITQLIYTVGNEQDYHFQVLFKILKKLGYKWADSLYHLSYGMVELPEGKMKSREGNVVDADDLMQEMYETAKAKAQELGKMEGLSEAQKEASYEIIGLGALKYFMLKVDPKKKMLFDPKKSVDFEGNTGPFIQYTYARIQSLLSKAEGAGKMDFANVSLNAFEKELMALIGSYRETVSKAAASLSPALIANFVYDLVKSYNSFYQNNPILNNGDEAVKNFRIELSRQTAAVIKSSLKLLGIETVDRM